MIKCWRLAFLLPVIISGQVPFAAETITLDSSCPCGPATQAFQYKTDAAVMTALVPVKASYLQGAARAAREVRQRTDFEYRVSDNGLFATELVVGVVPVVGNAYKKFNDWVRTNQKSFARDAAINALEEGLRRRPEIKTLDSATRMALVREAVKASREQPEYSEADAFQNEAIETLASEVEDIKTRQDLDHAKSKASRKTITIEDVIALKKLRDKNGMEQSPETKKRADEVTLRRQFEKAADVSGVVAGQTAAAADVAVKLGAPEVGATLARASQVADVGRVAFQALSGNPLAYLPMLSGVLGVLNVGVASGESSQMAWFAEAFKGISKQLTELSAQIEENQKQTMARLDYLAFLNEGSLTGINALLGQDADNCRYLVPESWYLKREAMDPALDLTKPLVFSSYDQVEKQFVEFRWDLCIKGLGNQFKTGKISTSATLINSNNPKKDNAKVKQLIELYNFAKIVYPPDAGRSYLVAPASYAEDLGAPSFQRYAEQIRLLEGANVWDPLLVADTELLDPNATAALGEYVLALHPLIVMTEGSRLVAFNRIKTGLSARARSSLDMLQIALGHVSLAIGQQQMLYGVIGEVNPKAEQSVVDEYFRRIPLAKVQLGAIAVCRLLPGRWEREQYATYYNNNDFVWLKTSLAAAVQPSIGADPVAAVINGEPRVTAMFNLLKDKQRADLILPKPEELGAVVNLRHTNEVLRLGRLQSRLALAIRAYSNPVASSDELRAYSEGAMLVTAGVHLAK